MALVQLVNKVTEFSEPLPSTETSQTNATVTKPTRSPSTVSPESHPTPKCSDPNIQKIINQNKTVFIGEGKLNSQQVKLHINENIKPVVQPQRRIPYHMRKAVSKELQKLVDEDIIEKVSDQPTPWISPIVSSPKKDGGTRICVDMKRLSVNGISCQHCQISKRK